MATKPWSQMSLEEKVESLHQQLQNLVGFINNAALTQIEGRFAELATRVSALETQNGATAPKR